MPALLCDARPVAGALEAIVRAAQACNGFNVVAGNAARATFGSNRSPGVVTLSRGIHGVSNAGLDTPWPKLVRAKAGLAGWIASGDDALDRLWPVLADRTPAAMHELPHTGLAPDRERLLSSPFIVSESYGTRCSTLVALGRDGEAQFRERSFAASGAMTGEVAFRFSIDQKRNSITRCAMPASSNTSPPATNP